MSPTVTFDLKPLLDRSSKGQIKVHIAPEQVLCQMTKGQHFHQHHELFIQTKGSSLFTFPRSEFVLEKGELLIIPNGVPHGEQGYGEEPMENLVLQAHPPHWFFHLGSAQPNERPSIHKGRTYRPPHIDLVLQQLDLLVQTRRATPRLQLVNSLFFAFLRMLENSKEVSKKRSLDELEQPSLGERCLNLVQSSYSLAECNVQFLARELKCSPPHLSRTFSAETGKSLHAMIMDFRMQQAKAHLKEGRFNVSQTAHACGYEDVSHFVSTFKKNFGITPKQYGLKSRGA
jgi:AraC-like DNA-binding protein/mannose-6-phosphate isomerase-like protein (cupin superfamily)